jgi:hypothetical protein
VRVDQLGARDTGLVACVVDTIDELKLAVYGREIAVGMAAVVDGDDVTGTTACSNSP